MKKILIALTLVAYMFGACTTSPTYTPVTVTLSASSSAETGLPTATKDIVVTVTNSSTQAASINWERTETQSVSGWTYVVNTSSSSSGVLSIAAGATTTVTLTINPNGMAGTGAGTLKFYDAENQSLTMKTFTYSLTATAVVLAPFTVTIPSSLADTVTTAAPATDFHMSVVNTNTTASVVVNWRRIDNTANPAGWVINICDLLLCYAPNKKAGFFTVPAAASGDFKVTINPSSVTGVGGSTILFYIQSDSVNTVISKTVDFTVIP